MSASPFGKKIFAATVAFLTFSTAAVAFAGARTTADVTTQQPTTPTQGQVLKENFSASDLLAPQIKAAIKNASDKKEQQNRQKAKLVEPVRFYRFPDFRTVEQIAREKAEKAEQAAAKKAATHPASMPATGAAGAPKSPAP